MQLECLFSNQIVVKTVRLPMEFVGWYYESNAQLHNDTLAVVYLVRDPRGVINSRKTRPWCARDMKCTSVVDLCADMRADYRIFGELAIKYPHNFILATFDELAAESDQEAKRLFKQLNLPFDDNVKQFVELHTKGNFNRMVTQLERNTIRNSELVAHKWKQEMPVPEQLFIEHFCHDVMDEIDYQVHNRKVIV